MNIENKNFILIATILILLVAIFSPKFTDLTGRVVQVTASELRDCELCVRYADSNGRAYADWKCGNFSGEEIWTNFVRDVDYNDDFDLKIQNCPKLQDCSLGVRYADSNRRESTNWLWTDFDGDPILINFVRDVDYNDDFDLKVECPTNIPDTIKDNCKICRRYADNHGRINAEWECESFNNTALKTDFVGDVDSNDQFDLKVDCNLDEISSGLIVCGNGIIDSGETCDSDTIPCIKTNNYIGTKTCKSDCTGYENCIATEYCGDDILNGPEECDDGNNVNADGCSSTCHIEVGITPPECGDGTLDSGEECDDGDTDDGDGCSSTCSLESCTTSGYRKRIGGIVHFCHPNDDKFHQTLQINDQCNHDYECEDNICSVTNKCLSYDALATAVCLFDPSSDWTGDQLALYASFGC